MGWSLGKEAPFLPVKRQSREPRLEPIPMTLSVMIVILSFADARREDIGRPTQPAFPSDLQDAALLKLRLFDVSGRLEDLWIPLDPARGLERGSQGPACDPHPRSVAHLLPLGRRRAEDVEIVDYH